jgi:hypothetical protein
MRCSLLFAALLLLLKQAAVSGEPPASNPYAGKSYGSCPGNYCESEDPALELQFWEAARTGDVKTVKQLLANDKLNLTRNVVPDDDGLARVVDVAVWVASEQGRVEVMRVSAYAICLVAAVHAPRCRCSCMALVLLCTGAIGPEGSRGRAASSTVCCVNVCAMQQARAALSSRT